MLRFVVPNKNFHHTKHCMWSLVVLGKMPCIVWLFHHCCVGHRFPNTGMRPMIEHQRFRYNRVDTCFHRNTLCFRFQSPPMMAKMIFGSNVWLEYMICHLGLWCTDNRVCRHCMVDIFGYIDWWIYGMLPRKMQMDCNCCCIKPGFEHS